MPEDNEFCHVSTPFVSKHISPKNLIFSIWYFLYWFKTSSFGDYWV